ncbi:hypothetical protein LAZ40_01515, partial [Cereibacter sphaeroides]
AGQDPAETQGSGGAGLSDYRRHLRERQAARSGTPPPSAPSPRNEDHPVRQRFARIPELVFFLLCIACALLGALVGWRWGTRLDWIVEDRFGYGTLVAPWLGAGAGAVIGWSVTRIVLVIGALVALACLVTRSDGIAIDLARWLLLADLFS